MKKTMPRHCGAILVVLVLIESQLSAANPNSADPNLGLDVHGESSKVPHEVCQTTLEKTTTILDDFLKQAEAGRAGRVSASQIGQVNVQLIVADRAAERLGVLGETAGIDYKDRINRQRARLNQFLGLYYADPNYPRAFEQAVKVADKQKPTRTKQITKIRKLIGEEKWEQAETTLFQVSDQVQQLVPILGPVRSQIYTNEYRQEESNIRLVMQPKWAQVGRGLLQERIRDETVDLSAMAGKINQWGRSLRQSATVAVEGNDLTGPELVTLAATEWEAAQAKTIHRIALTWLLREYHGPSENSADLSLPTTDNETDSNLTQYEAATADIRKTIIGLIRADAARASEAEVGQLYLAHLKAWAPLLNRGGEQHFAPVDTALQELAAKSSGVAREVNAYASATSDLLRWRRRVAGARGSVAAASSVDGATQFRETAESGNAIPGFYYPRSEQSAVVSSRLPEVVQRVADQAVGTQVQTQGFWSLGQGRPLISLLHPDCYASATALDTTQPQQSLARDLQVDEKNPPLTLLATTAIESAAAGRYDRLGGEASAITVESLTTRLITVPTTTGVLFPLGDFSQLTGTGLKANVILRYDLVSQWAQNRYFFVSK